MTDEPWMQELPRRLSAQGDQAVRGHVHGDRETVPRGLDELALEVLALAKATACTRTSISPYASRHRVMTDAICSSDATSQASTKVDPIEVGSGRTRRSRSDLIDANPTVAPSPWNARAMPQAIEWSFATPKISAFLPSSRPIDPPSCCDPRRAYHRARATN